MDALKLGAFAAFRFILEEVTVKVIHDYISCQHVIVLLQ